MIENDHVIILVKRMEKKVSIATCNGMSALGLIGRAACNDLVTQNDEVVSICITATAAGNEDFNSSMSKYPILAINGCSGNCVNKILKFKGINTKKSFNIDKFLKNGNLKVEDPSRLDENGEIIVEKLKKTLENEINFMKNY